MAGVDLVELQNKVLKLEKSFAELAKWTKFHFNFNPEENVSNVFEIEIEIESPASEPTSRPVPVANVEVSETVGESTLIKRNGRRDLGEIRVVCKEEMDENEEQDGINNPHPQGTSPDGTQVEAPIPDRISAGVVQQAEDEGIIKTKDDKVKDCSEKGDLNSSISQGLSAENGKTARNKNKSSTTAKSSCGKSPLISMKRLSSAQKKKTGVKSKPGWKCPHCPRIRSCKSELAIHMRSHSGERPFSCPHCPLAMGQASSLRRHIRRIHPELNQNLLECKICQNKFQSQKVLWEHFKKHLECYFCSQRVKDMKCMRYHLAIHTCEKPFGCPHCQHSSARGFSLKQHMKRIHGKK